MKKFIAAVSTVFIAVTLSIVAVAAPASAHTATLSATVACNSDTGSATVTWTIDNDYNELVTVTASNNTAIPVGSTVAATGGGADTTKQFTQIIPAPAAGKTATATLNFQWTGDGFTQNNTKFTTSKVSSNCVVPTPKDASAVLIFTPPTCTSGQLVAEGATTNATWNGNVTIKNGKYSAEADAASGHEFSDGSTVMKFSGTLQGQLTGETCDNTDTKIRICHATASNTNPYVDETVDYNSIVNGGGGHGQSGVNAGDIIPPFSYIVGGVTYQYAGQNWTTDNQAIYNNDCKIPPVPQCIPDSMVSYTYSANDSNSGVITVPSVPGSTGLLCNPFWVVATSWTFTNPSSIWPQNLDQANPTGEISTPGTYDFGAPVTCGQGDIYASFNQNDATLSPTPQLFGPSNPFIEHFLHQMGFSGPNPTYTQDNVNCFVPTPETGNPTTTVATCAADSANTITLPAVPGGVWEITDGTQDVTYPIGQGVNDFVPADFDQYTITLVDGNSADGYLVTPTTTQYTPVNPDSLDCNTQVTPVKPSVTKIRTCDATGSLTLTPAAGIDYYVNGVQVTQGTNVVAGQTNPVTGLSGKVTVTAVAETGYEFTADSTSSWKFWLGKETTCSWTATYGDCTASNGVSSESFSLTFVNPGKHTASFTVTGGTDNVNETFTVPGHTTSAVTLIDATAQSGDTFYVSVNGGPTTAVNVPQFDGCQTAVGGDPSASQATCNQDEHTVNNNASITIDLEPGLVYEITGPGGYDNAGLTPASNGGTDGDYTISGLVSGDYLVSVTAASGYVLDSKYTTDSWPFKLTLSTPVCDIAVSVTPAQCEQIESAGIHTDTTGVPSITVSLDPDLVYTARKVDAPTGTQVLTSTTTDVAAGEYFVDVTLSAQGIADGVTLPGGATTITYGAEGVNAADPFDLTAFCPPVEATWNAGASGTNAVCTSGTTTDGVITLVHTVGQEGKVTYTITNTKTNTVVYTGNTDTTVNVPAGSYSVKATPPAGDGISGNPQNNPDGSEIFPTIVIGTTSTDCDGTLAFTGGTIAWLGFVLAGGMLFLGIALLYMRRRGNRTAE